MKVVIADLEAEALGLTVSAGSSTRGTTRPSEWATFRLLDSDFGMLPLSSATMHWRVVPRLTIAAPSDTAGHEC